MRIVFALLALLALSACGLSPMYAGGTSSGAARGIAGGSLAQTGFFAPTAISTMAEAHIAGRADHSRTLWQLLMLEKSLTQLGVSG